MMTDTEVDELIARVRAGTVSVLVHVEEAHCSANYAAAGQMSQERMTRTSRGERVVSIYKVPRPEDLRKRSQNGITMEQAKKLIAAGAEDAGADLDP